MGRCFTVRSSRADNIVGPTRRGRRCSPSETGSGESKPLLVNRPDLQPEVPYPRAYEVASRQPSTCRGEEAGERRDAEWAALSPPREDGTPPAAERRPARG